MSYPGFFKTPLVHSSCMWSVSTGLVENGDTTFTGLYDLSTMA